MNPLALLEDPLRWLLDFLHENANLTYGWSIVVLTLIVRSALLPLVIKQYSSMRSMQMVAPQLKELQAKYKGNRQKLNEELMAFYKENQINPFASCLPLVAQLPIFIALYYVLKDFSNTATGSDLSFMWLIPDVAADFTFSAASLVLVVIYGLSQLLSTELSATPNMPESQRRIMRFIPIVVVIFVFQFTVPAGLVLYWMTTNLWTCGQQLVMRHRIGLHLADPAEVEKMAAQTAKKGSRTPPKTEGALALAETEEEPEAEARPKRRGRSRNGDATESPAGEATTAPEPETAPEPTSAPEASAPEASAPEAAPGTSGNGKPTANRRQPRPKGTAKGSRPASGSRSKKKR
ncbi:MAG: membrane protein insertase YidC [Thermoleophilia bacterium]|nr:membrane protein insertase YidC [Thermoleophilia bacterium]